MKKLFILPFALAAFLLLPSCGGDSPESVGKKWCEMETKKEAASGDEKDKIREEQKAYENEIESKYKDDKEFMNGVEDYIEKNCD
ncbi:MAG: hypothetical protein V2A54_14270 [Bacteroidota bacterium]